MIDKIVGFGLNILSDGLDRVGSESSEEENKVKRTKKLALSAVLTAVAVSLSGFYIPLGSTKCYPIQHMTNAIAGVLLGPWYASIMAVITGLIRNILGLGTIYAFPGGIPGALVVGLVYRYIIKEDYASLTEALGTVVIGASISALAISPFMGHKLTLYFLWIAFAASSVPGSILGYIILKTLRRLKIAESILQ